VSALQLQSSSRHQRGVGLIEIMVVVLLLSIGFLTAARMQIAGMRFSQSAYYQSQASFMASDIIDRMRANLDGVRAGLYDGLTTSSSTIDPGCNSQMCSPADIAKQDLFDWSAYLHANAGTKNFLPLLPSTGSIAAQGSVTRIADGHFSVNLTWAEYVDGKPVAVPMRVDFVTEF